MGRYHSLTRLLVTALVWLSAPHADAQNIWYVDDDNCPGPGSGTADDPFCTIQAGIDAASHYDVVLVADGMYTGPGNTNLTYPINHVTVRSANGPDNCIIECMRQSQAVVFEGRDADTIFEGFTVRGGQAFLGAAISCIGGRPTIRNCVFEDNMAAYGGAIYGYQSSPTVVGCMFIYNQGQYGGAVCTEYGAPIIANCRFVANEAFKGGGLRTAWGSARLINCLLVGNHADHTGGACIIAHDAQPILTNCTLVSNDADVEGGGIFIWSGGVRLYNSILWANSDGDGSNESAQLHTNDYPAWVSHSCIQGWTGGLGGNGNVGVDPLFVDADGADGQVGTPDDNLRLSRQSPCMNAGHTGLILPDLADLDEDGDVIELTPIDLDGNPRIWPKAAPPDDDQAPPAAAVEPLGPVGPIRRSSSVAEKVVDMGAYELYPRLYVDANAQGLNDGTSWQDAFLQLHDVWDVAVPGEEILVADGTYKPATLGLDDPRQATFQLLNWMSIRGGYAGDGAPDPDERDIVTYETILSGDIGIQGDASDNCYHVVTCENADDSTLLDGVTITWGNALGAAPMTHSSGGGLYIDYGDLTVKDCTFTSHRGNDGGAIHLGHGNPTLIRCLFRDNYADWLGGAIAKLRGRCALNECTFVENQALLYGGAVVGNDVTIIGCTFVENQAVAYGGAVTGNDMTIVNCWFSANASPGDGGAVECDSHTNFASCMFAGNTCDGDGGAVRGSGSFVNCVFTGNHAGGDGGAIRGRPALVNCTLSQNSAEGHGGGIRGAPTIANSIFWENSDSNGVNMASQIHVVGGPAHVSYSCVQGLPAGLDGFGNIGDDPRLLHAAGPDAIPGTDDDNLRLWRDSPCLDAGDHTVLPLDWPDLDADGDALEPIPFDLDGRPRIIDEPGIPAPGPHKPGFPQAHWLSPRGRPDIAPLTLDMGAYEGVSPPPCPGDLDGDSVRDVTDFTLFAAAFTSSYGDLHFDPYADLNGDGVVNVTDFAIFAEGYGQACP